MTKIDTTCLEFKAGPESDWLRVSIAPLTDNPGARAIVTLLEHKPRGTTITIHVPATDGTEPDPLDRPNWRRQEDHWTWRLVYEGE